MKKEKKLAKKLAVFAEQPQYTQHRSNKWTELKKKYDQEVAAKGQEIIKVRLLDGKIIEGFSWELTPLDVAKQISHSLASEVYIAKIDNVLWDLERPLESDCGIQLFKFDSPDAKAAYWTTAACTLAEALERLYCMDNSSVVCNVGSTQTGFFADIHSKQKSVNDSVNFQQLMLNAYPHLDQQKRICCNRRKYFQNTHSTTSQCRTYCDNEK